MTQKEFDIRLKNAKTTKDICFLRYICDANKYKCACKNKFRIIAETEGFEHFEISLTYLKQITLCTSCGSTFCYHVKDSDTIFCNYKNIFCYVNSKYGKKVEIFVKTFKAGEAF